MEIHRATQQQFVPYAAATAVGCAECRGGPGGARTALAAALDSGMGARKRPSARFSRYASGAEPTTIRSAGHSSPPDGCCWGKRRYSS